MNVVGNSDVKIKYSSFIWQKGNKNSCLNITDIIIDNPSVTVHIPKLLIYFKLGSLLKTQTELFHLSTNSVYIRTQNNQEPRITQQDLVITIWKLFNSLDEKSRIEVHNIIINHNTKDESHIGTLDINKKEDLIIRIHTDDEYGILHDLSMTIEKRNNVLTMYGTFDNLRFDKLIKDNRLIKDVGLQGNLLLKINKQNEITEGKVYILSVKHNVLQALNDVNINLVYSNNVIDIKNYHFRVNDTYVSLVGTMSFNTNQASKLRINISKFSSQDSCIYMPKSIVNDKLQEWYCNNISGNMLNTIINFHGDIKNVNLSDVTISADIEDTSVKFNNGFEYVKRLNGNLELKDKNLKIIVNSAEFRDFAISGEIGMSSLDKEDAVLNIYGEAVSDAYALYATRLDKILEVEKDEISGVTQSQFSFQVFNLNLNGSEVDFLGNIHSKINNLIIYNTNIGDYDIYLKLGKQFMLLNGISNQKMTFDFKQHDTNSVFKLTGNLPAQVIKNYVGVDGYLSLDIESSMNSDNTGFINGNIDLSELILQSSYLGWKGGLQDLVFSIKLEDANKLLLDKLHIVGDNLDINLTGKRENENLYLSSSTFKLPDNDFNITIESNKSQDTFTIYGKEINLSDMVTSLIQSSDRISEKNIKVNMYVDNMMMQDGIIIRDVKLDLSCTGSDCSGSKFVGQFLQDNSNISAEYSKIGLEIYADNAEMFFRSLGITRSVKHGKISFYLSPNMENKKRYGMASMSSFYIKDAPLLTTLLSMSSFSGIVNTLNKEGIYFYRCNIPFSYGDDIVEIEHSSLTATELYITAGGILNIKDYKFQIAGEIVPLYFINKFLSKIPVIGKLLTGGKSRGIIAIDYKASGDDKNSNASVNFITSVTPNLFKRVLGIFDKMMTKVNKKRKKPYDL